MTQCECQACAFDRLSTADRAKERERQQQAAKPYRVGVIERGTSGPPIFNALRFDTREEATVYGEDLLSRWSGIIAYKVEEVSE